MDSGALFIDVNIANVGVSNAAAGVLPINCRQLIRQVQYLRHANVQLDGEAASLLLSSHENIEPEFYRLLREWKASGRTKSLVSSLTKSSAYLQIIGMGKDAIPLILKELERELDHWFLALEMIARENPVPEESKGNLEEMARIWIQWGLTHGYVR